MKQKTSKKLAKLVLCSVLAASVCGNSVVFAADELHATEDMKPISSFGDLVYETQYVEAEEGSGRYAAITAVKGDIDVTAPNIKVTSIGNSKAERIYGILLRDNKNITINGDLDVTVSGDKKDGTKQVRALRNSGTGTFNINGDTVVNATIINSNSGEDYITGVDTWDGGTTNFNGNVEINSMGSTNSSLWANAVQIGGGHINFNGDKTILNANNQGYTAQTVMVQGDKYDDNYNIGFLDFNSNYTTITAKSDYGATGVGFGDEDGVVKFNKGYVEINAIITDGVGQSNVIGLLLGGETVNISKDVESMTINVEGSGVDKGDMNHSNGTAGIYNSVSDLKIDSQVLTINVIAGQDTENVKFDKEQAEKNDSNGNTVSDSFGIRADCGAVTTVGADTDTKISVNDGYKNAVGVYAGTFVQYVEDGAGEVSILGNVDISATGIKSSKALYAKDGGIINLGSTGKTVSLTGDVVADAGTINLAGETTVNGELSTANDGNINFTAGNVLSSLNIVSGSNANLTGATMKINDFASAITGDGKLTIKDNGIIETTSDKVFTNVASATNNESGKVLDAVTGKVNFVGGTVNLTDNEYTLDYAKDAQENMSKVIVDGNGSKTQIVMSGNLASGNVTTVDEASKVGNDVALDKVTVNAEKNLIVGTDVAPANDVEGIDVQDAITNGFNVGGLNLAADSTGMVITNDKEVTLGGSVGGTVVTVNGKEEAVKVVVGTNDLVDGTSVKEGTFNIGNALATADTEYTLNGSVTVNAGSDFNTKGQVNVTDNITLAGGVANAEIGKLKTENINVTATDSTVTGNIEAENLNMDANAVLNVGDAENAGNLVVKEATLNGGVVFLDPEWKDGVGIDGATNMAVEGTTIDGTYAVGRNSILSFGVDNIVAAQEVFAKTGLEWSKDEVTAAMYIAKGVNVASGAIIVNGAMDKAPAAANDGTVNFADSSLLMVNGAEITGTNAAITGVKGVTVADNSKLFIDGAIKGTVYNIIGDFETTGWKADNILSDNALIKFEDNGSNDKFDVTAALKKVSEVYGDAVVIDKVIDETLDKHESSAAADFFKAAVNINNNATTAAQVDALNASANIGELGGSSRNTYVASNLLTDAVAEHMSLANEKDHDQDIWAHYVHSKENVDGLALGGMTANYDTQYNGIVVGADLYKNGKGTIGTALTYIDGSTTGSSLASSTKNDATYYGMSIYGGVVNEDSAVIGDISYLHGKNDITQHNSGATLTAEPETDAFSIGVKAERSFKAGNGKIVPYAGLRYMHLGTGNYANSIDMNYDVDDANLFLLPVGVKYSTTHKTAGWTLRPIVEVGYVWTMGDRDIDQTVSLNGASNGFGFNIADSGAYIGRFAVEAEKANVTYGLGYEYQKGDSTKYNKWMANVNWKF